MPRGATRNVGTTPDGSPVDVVEWLDENGRVVRWSVEVGGVEVADFNDLENALDHAERLAKDREDDPDEDPEPPAPIPGPPGSKR